MSSSRRIRRSVGEGVVILLSILLAFAIDAWWDDRGDARAEARLLESIRADLESTRLDLMAVDSRIQAESRRTSFLGARIPGRSLR